MCVGGWVGGWGEGVGGLQVYAVGFDTTSEPALIPFRTRNAQTIVVKLLDLTNNISYRLHNTREWSTAGLNLIEKDMARMLDDWFSLNKLAHELYPGRTDKENPIITWEGMEKVGALNTVTSSIEWLGAFRHQSSAVGEKAHIGPKHCLEMSKGKNKDANSIKQAQRLEYHDLRDVHTKTEIAKRKAEALVDEDEMENAPKTGVVLRGWEILDAALPSLQNDLAARICHLVREAVQKQVLKKKAGQARDDAQADFDALIARIPPQRATPTGACTHLCVCAMYLVCFFNTHIYMPLGDKAHRCA